MKTPIADFVREYNRKGGVRLHMPGHKGKGPLGCEALDITEITGADVLYSADGIIVESENNAARLFGTAHTFYSTEGSTLAIKAMLAIATTSPNRERPLILAARNAHKAFVYACALLDLEVEWLYPSSDGHFCACEITPAELEAALGSLKKKPSAVYVTSPDYLGNILDIKGLAEICHKNAVPLLVDNAHGAYLGFLDKSMHPIALGADMCCDSAHKTLPVLTGGAYLHISSSADKEFVECATQKLALFASTSPSYLILQSLDLCNAYIENGYRERLRELCEGLAQLKARLKAAGYNITGNEPLKIVIEASGAFSGYDIAAHLSSRGIEVELADRDFAVMMLTPENSDSDISRLEDALLSFEGLNNAQTERKGAPHIEQAHKAMSIREAIFKKSEMIPIGEASGRICAAPTVSCPPAVPIAVAGEIISASHVRALEYYNVERICVIKNEK